MTNLKYRILLIVVLIAASGWALFPRTTIERVKRNGIFVYDTIQRVPLKKGLDLQGGMYLALAVDESKGAIANKEDALDRALKVVRSRIDEFGVSEPVVQKAGTDRIIVELPGIDDPQRAEQVVQDQAFLQFMITDKTQALQRSLPRLDQVVRDLGAEKVFGGDTTNKSAVNAQAGLQKLFGEKDSTQKSDSTKKDSTSVPGLSTTTGPISSIVRDGQIPGEYLVADPDVPRAEHYFSLPEVQAVLPPGKVIRWGSDSVSAAGVIYRPLYVLDARPIMTGDMLQDAKPNNSPIEGTIVEFELNNEGGRRFRSETAKHIQDYMAIVLDDKRDGTPAGHPERHRDARPDHHGTASDLQAAQDLALVLRAGALPVPLKVEEVRNIGASLGADSIAQGDTRALAISMLVVVLIMLVYYRFSGCSPCSRLSMYMLFTHGRRWRDSAPCSRCPGWRDSCCRSASRSTPTC